MDTEALDVPSTTSPRMTPLMPSDEGHGVIEPADLVERVQACLGFGLDFALVVLECDRTQEICDTLGQQAREQLLRHVGERIRCGLRHSDVTEEALVGDSASEGFTARLSAHRFIVLAAGIADDAAASALAHRLVLRVSQPYDMEGLSVAATASIGVTRSGGRTDARAMLRDAETATAEAHRRGGRCFVMFEPLMHWRAAAELEIETQLRQALVTGQLRVAFQPIVELATGEVAGFEALARWRHPVKGDIGPSEFISVAERCGLIAELGMAVLRLASRQFAHWRADGMASQCRLSVNLSRAQLSDPDFSKQVAELLTHEGLPPECLQLEITESLAMRDESTRQALADLRALGVRLSLDDFGTGHSSLASLNEFPVQQVKIDRSFVCDLETSHYHKALIRACIQMAVALDLDVVAEGVETKEQARLLCELGCHKAQGWYFARPLESTDVPAFLCRPPEPMNEAEPADLLAAASIDLRAGSWSREEQAPTLALVLSRRMWLPRLAGLPMGALVVGSVLWNQQINVVAWACLGLHALAWPWLARNWARTSRTPMAVERRTLLLDSAFAAVWLPVMAFQPLPSAVLLAMLTMQNVAMGGWRLGIKGAGCQLAGVLAGIALAGVSFTPDSSHTTQALSLGFLLIYSSCVGALSHESARSVNRKRMQLARSEKIQREVLDAIDAGIVLYDAEDRVVLWNRQFERLYEPIAPLLEPGMTFAELVELEIRHGMAPPAQGCIQAWKEERLRQHRHSNRPVARQMADGSWQRVVEHRLATGGLLWSSTEAPAASAR